MTLDPRAYGFPSEAVLKLHDITHDPDSEMAKYWRPIWPAGPWDREPFDYVYWQQDGYDCLLTRNRMGAWCGYVGVGSEHPWYSVGYSSCVRGHRDKTQKEELRRYRRNRELAKTKQERDSWDNLAKLTERYYHPSATCEEYDHTPESILNVHGGITYADMEHEEGWIKRPEVTEPKRWFFGFDTHHYMDVSPGMLALSQWMHEKLQTEPEDVTNDEFGTYSSHDLFSDHLHFNPEVGTLERYGQVQEYRDVSYVKHEMELLLEQIAAAARFNWKDAVLPSKPPLGQRMSTRRRKTLEAVPQAPPTPKL